MTGLSRAVSWSAAATDVNDALLRRVKTEVPDFVAAHEVYRRLGGQS